MGIEPTLLASQPPSGGCELKREKGGGVSHGLDQPPSGGCELKLAISAAVAVQMSSRLRAAVS